MNHLNWGRSVLASATVGAMTLTALGLAASASAATTTTVVTNDQIVEWDAAAMPATNPPTTWFKQKDDQKGAAVGTIVRDASTQAKANGSLHLATPGADDKVTLKNQPAKATKLSDFTVGSYQNRVNKGTAPATYQLVLDCNGGTLTDGGFTSLNFVDPGQTSGWKTYDVVNGGNAMWWSTRTINEDGSTTGSSTPPVGTGLQGGQDAPHSLSAFKKACAAGTVLTYGVSMGSGSAGLDSNVDDIVFNTEANDFVSFVAERVAGADRVETAIAGSEAMFDSAGTKGAATAVVLVSAVAWADGVSAGALASEADGPLLMTKGTALDQRTAAEIKRVLAKKGTVYLVGGTGSLSNGVEQAVQGLGYSTHRLGGANRFATAVAVAKHFGPVETAMLTSGSDFPDALSAGPAAAREGGVVLLTKGDAMATETAAYLKSSSTIKNVYAIGGSAAKAAPSVPSAMRAVGSDRYDTSAKVAAKFFSTTDSAAFASGEAFADALSGGAFAGLADMPILLVKHNVLPSPVSRFLSDRSAQITSAAVFGGPAVVSDGVVATIERIVNTGK